EAVSACVAVLVAHYGVLPEQAHAVAFRIQYRQEIDGERAHRKGLPSRGPALTLPGEPSPMRGTLSWPACCCQPACCSWWGLVASHLPGGGWTRARSRSG